MPRLSYFYGIAVYIYWDDHNPPHYHATYGEHEAWIVIADGSVLQGSLTRRGAAPRAHVAPPASRRIGGGLGEGQGHQAPGTIEPLP